MEQAQDGSLAEPRGRTAAAARGSGAPESGGRKEECGAVREAGRGKSFVCGHLYGLSVQKHDGAFRAFLDRGDNLLYQLCASDISDGEEEGQRGLYGGHRTSRSVHRFNRKRMDRVAQLRSSLSSGGGAGFTQFLSGRRLGSGKICGGNRGRALRSHGICHEAFYRRGRLAKEQSAKRERKRKLYCGRHRHRHSLCPFSGEPFGQCGYGVCGYGAWIF